MTPVLRLERASFAVPGLSPAQDVDLSLAPSELLVVTGPQGAGKSTLLRGVLGLAPLVSGNAHLFGSDLRALHHDSWMALRARCSYASWTAPLLANLTLADNLAVPLLMRSIAQNNVQSDVDRMLERFGLTALADQRVPELLGDKHRLGLLARALLIPADLLLVDDPPAGPVVDAALEDARQTGQAVLVSTRHPERFATARHVELRAPDGDVDAPAPAVR